jgi:hypothetical protein
MYDMCMEYILQYKPKSLHLAMIAQIFRFFFKIAN